MSDLFFYGTLRHVPLLRIVLGRDAAGLPEDALIPDTLPGYRTLQAAGGDYPTILPASPPHASEGQVLRDVSPQELARLSFYEAGFGYGLAAATTGQGRAVSVFLPPPDQAPDQAQDQAQAPNAAPWDLAQWQARWGPMTEHAAREVMGAMGRLRPDEIARRYSRIRARAWSKVLAAQAPALPEAARTFAGQVEILAHTQPHSGFFTVEALRLRHTTFQGGMSPPLEREVFTISDAAFVLPYDPVRDRVLLVEQVRMGPLVRGDTACWQLEPIAGLIDPGESPEQAIRREAREEAGLTLGTLWPVGRCYASPGATTDFFHLFVGQCDLPDGTAGLGGAPEEGENIRSHLMAWDVLLDLAERQALANVPLALLTYWLARHRGRLRAEPGTG